MIALCLYILDNYLSLNAVSQTVLARLQIGWSALRLWGLAVRPPQHGPRMATGMGSEPEGQNFSGREAKPPGSFRDWPSTPLMTGDGWKGDISKLLGCACIGNLPRDQTMIAPDSNLTVITGRMAERLVQSQMIVTS